jgi:Mrp family chromosome partitioning ATPase
MSLMLHALKRIEAKQSSGRKRPTVDVSGTLRVPLEGGARGVPDTSQANDAYWDGILENLALPNANSLERAVSLDSAMDQIQALISEARELNGTGAPLDQARYDEEELPVIEPLNSDPYSATARRILGQLSPGCLQLLLFTSPSEGQGKTMTLARLAPGLAQGIQGNVLVVDANFHNPDMARWLAVAPSWRLPDVLRGAADWGAAVRPTAIQGVSLLPGGRESPERGIALQGMGQLLRELACHYDLVVVDACSLVHRAAVQLAAVCDGTYLVLRLGQVSRQMVREAAQVVDGNGGRLLGCVAIDAG